MAVAVRSVRGEELGALYRMRLRSLAEDPDAFDQTVADIEVKGIEPLAEILALAATGWELVLFGEVDGEVAGLVFVSRSKRPRSQHRARLWGMWVAPQA
jgi:hypothetical protein